MVKTSDVRASASYRRMWLPLLFLFALPALAPLFSPAPTQSADGLLHLYRLVQLDALWRSGIFFSRWLPDVAYGYGMPVLNYYAPLVYYLTTPLYTIGFSFARALNLSLAAAVFVGAAGMFFFTRALLQSQTDKFKDAAFEGTALIAALAFLYAPYVLFNALQRANLAEQWALALAPFALWRFLELTRRANALNWALAILLFAAVLLSHNVTGFLFAPLLLLFTIACVVAQGTPRSPREWVWTLSAFGLAVTLAAFFLLPALLERDYAQITRVIVTPDFDYRFNFVAPNELLAPLPRADTGRLNPSYPNTLGLVQVILASVGFVVLVVRLRTRRSLPFFALTGAALGFTLLMLAVSRPVWDSISLLEFVQLPMRMRGLVALCLAPLTGIFLLVPAERWRVFATCFAVVALVLSAVPMLYPRYADDTPSSPTLNDMFAYEQTSGAFGTTSFGEYLPVWAQVLPNQTPFEEAYARSEAPNRFVIPDGVTLCGEKITPLAQQLCATADTSWHAVYRSFYFPGWRAYVDNNPVEITPTPRTGLISFEVPRSSTVRVEYQGTEVETIAVWISIASGVFVVGIVLYKLVREQPISQAGSSGSTASDSSRGSILIALTVVALGLAAFKFLYLDRVSNPFVAHFDGATVEGISRPRSVPFDGAMQFLGYDTNAAQTRRGDPLHVTLYWRVLPGLQQNLSTYVHLTAADGFVVAQADSLHPAQVPTSRWDTDAYGADQHTLEIPASLAPGTYELRGGVYDPTTNTRLKTGDGNDYISLGNLEVK